MSRSGTTDDGQKRLDACETVRKALDAKPGESVVVAAARVLNAGTGRVDVAQIIIPPQASDEAWRRMFEAAEVARRPRLVAK